MKRATIAAALATAVLSTPAFAAEQSSLPITKAIGHSIVEYENGHATLHSEGARGFHAPALSHDGLATIFSNLATAYPDSLYYCCTSLLLTGPEGVPGIFPEIWEAAAFTPATDIRIKEIDLPISYNMGTNGVTVVLYDDNANLPGNPIKKFKIENTAEAGLCCGLIAVKDHDGIPVTGGKQYWVALETSKNTADFVGGWNTNTTEQITMIPEATFCSDDIAHTGSCQSINDIWAKETGLPEVAFAVYGK